MARGPVQNFRVARDQFDSTPPLLARPFSSGQRQRRAASPGLVPAPCWGWPASALCHGYFCLGLSARLEQAFGLRLPSVGFSRGPRRQACEFLASELSGLRSPRPSSGLRILALDSPGFAVPVIYFILSHSSPGFVVPSLFCYILTPGFALPWTTPGLRFALSFTFLSAVEGLPAHHYRHLGYGCR